MELNTLDNIEEHESDEEEASSGSGSSDEDDGMVEEDETYVKFVRSVFFDDYSGCSNTDEDDEEDYEPENHDDEDSDNDDEEDKDLIRVQNRELRELVDGCWQTIVGEAPTVAAVPFKEETVDEGRVSSPLRTRNEGAEQQEVAASATPPHNTSSGLFDNIDEELDLSLLSPTPALPRVRPSSVPASITAAPVETGTKPKASAAAGPSVISNMVTKLFSESETSEAHVEGMPVHACRKLVARQMSMATQLLVQLLLQADERSDCFTKAFASLMELSNLREAALKKATLVQMNYQNATTIRNHVQDQRQQKLRESNASSAGSTNDCGDDSSESENEYGVRRFRPSGAMSSSSSRVNRSYPGVSNDVLDAFVVGGSGGSSGSGGNNSGADTNTGRRLTRSAVQSERTVHSVFNVPILAKVSTLFDMIDVSRRHIKLRVGNTSSVSDKGIGGEGSALVRAHTLHAIREQVYTILPRMKMPAWRCLLPSAHYPLPRDIVRKLDPSTLTGRCLFTPTEDDLLLRGVMNIVSADSMWERIRNFYVPSKEAQLLEFRFTQMTSVSAVEDNNFKGYQKLSSDYRERDHEWTHAEQLELLRGFQAFGERWPLVRIFHLPHRRAQQLRAKWFRLQKDWQKVFQTQMYKSGAQREMTPEMRSFLSGLNSQAIEATAARLAARQQAAASRADAPSGLAGSVVRPGAQAASQGTRSRDKQISMNPSSRNPLPSIPAGPAVPAPLQGWPLALSHPTALPMSAGPPHAAPMGGFPLPFMAPPWLQPGGKTPTTHAEFVAQQQQFQQYQQFMMHQHQMFMLHQMQSQLQSQMHLPPQYAHQSQVLSQTPFVPNNFPGASGAYLPAANMPSALPVSHDAPRATAALTTGARDRSPFGESIVDGPPLLRDSTPEKSKRVRKYNGAGSMSSSGANSTSAPALASSSAPAPAASGTEDMSSGLGYLHDQDSMFSLLMSGNSIGFLDPTASVPMLDSESAGSNSRSQEASLLSRVKAGSATASQPEKPAKACPPPSTLTTQASTAQNPAAPTLKSILSKPKKKTIKPTLISSSVGGPAALFETKRASPAFGLTAGAGTAAGAAACSLSSGTSSAAQKVPASSNSTGSTVPAAPRTDFLGEDRSMMGFEGLSNMCFPDDDQRLGMDEGASLHSPFLQGQSLLDASSFAFSNISRPREDIESGGKKGGAKRAAKEAPDGAKKSKKAKKSADAGSSAPSGASAVQDSVQFAFDETSNMSILGDFYNDADMGGVSNIGFSNITNLLSLAGSPQKSSAGRGVAAGSRSGHSRSGNSRGGPAKRGVAAAPVAPPPPSGSSQRSFHHIAAAATASHSSAVPVTVAAAPRTESGAAPLGSRGVSASAAEASMRSPKKPKSGGIFAEVMANARKNK